MQRREVNRKIRELSECVEVTRQTISNYESGRVVSRVVERVIEWELDSAIDNCTDPIIKDLCEQLKAIRV